MNDIDSALERIAQQRQEIEEALEDELENLKAQYAKLGIRLEVTKLLEGDEHPKPTTPSKKVAVPAENGLSTAAKREILAARGREIGTRRWTKEEAESWADLERYGEASLPMAEATEQKSAVATAADAEPY
jgi:hypothetical protein